MARFYEDSFDFRLGDLGANLATLNERTKNYIEIELNAATGVGERQMALRAPWTMTGFRNRWGRLSTGAAREGLWAAHSEEGNTYRIHMGHDVYYGIYLEKNWGGRYQIVMPILVETARNFMETLRYALNHIDTPAPIGEITPSVGRKGTSQGILERASQITGGQKGITIRFRDAKGRFAKYLGVTVGEGAPGTKKTRRTKKTKSTKRYM